MKQNTTQSCLNCKGCCKFEEEKLYFAPLFTKDELRKIDVKKAEFKPYKNSNNVYQIKLKKQNNLYICPFLKQNHLCEIYNERPFDCRFWPFMFMKKNNKVYLCCDTDLCPEVEELTEKQFNELKDKVLKYIKDNNILDLIKTHKDLIWDYEEDTFIIKEIK